MTEKKKDDRPKKWIACPIEDAYFGSTLKESRVERKRRSEKDRSKFKKTDYKKYKANLRQEFQDKIADRDLVEGRVLSITSQGYIVEHEGETFTCTIRGLLKKEKRQLKNLVAVGDFVLFEKMPDHEGSITVVKPRNSVLSRADNLSRNKEHIIAANIDQVLITASVVSPELKTSLIDRYIIAAIKGNMQPVILINKSDLLNNPNFADDLRQEQKILLEQCQKAYAKTGIPLLVLSAEKEQGLDQLKQVMMGKSSVFSGQSGTGKSSLINAMTGLNIPVGETVKRTRKGAHTTTNPHLVHLKFEGWCIDTPGIKSFGVWDLDPKTIKHYYTEIETFGQECKFPDCTHTHEKECAVIKAVEKGEISPLRYDSYKSLLETIQEEHLRR